MAKLIGHYFNTQPGEFILFEVNGLKETAKRFTKSKETTNSFPGWSPDYWTFMPKSQLDKITVERSKIIMYSCQENIERFKGLVFAQLETEVEAAKEKYDTAMRALKSAFEAEIFK